MKFTPLVHTDAPVSPVLRLLPFHGCLFSAGKADAKTLFHWWSGRRSPLAAGGWGPP